MRKTTGNSASQQILLEHSLSINQKKKKKKNLHLPSTKKASTTEACITIVLSLEIYANKKEHSVLFHQKISIAEDGRHT